MAIVDNIIANLKENEENKKRVNSSRKGKRGEANVLPLLIERFKLPFARKPQTLGSGGWATQHAETLKEGKLDMDSLAGDIITPKGFGFCIEVKSGYDIELINLFQGTKKKSDQKQLQDFFDQVSRDSKRVNKQPLLIYHKDNCPSIVFLETKTLKPYCSCIYPIFYYNTQWVCLSFVSLLELPSEFFFASQASSDQLPTAK